MKSLPARQNSLRRRKEFPAPTGEAMRGFVRNAPELKRKLTAGTAALAGYLKNFPAEFPAAGNRGSSLIRTPRVPPGSYAHPNRPIIARPMIQSLSSSERNGNSSVKCAMRCRYVALAKEFVMSVPQWHRCGPNTS